MHIIRNRRLITVMIMSTLRTMSQRGVETFLPLFILNEIGAGPAWLGICLAALTISASLPVPLMGYLSDRLNRRRFLGGCLLAASGVIGLLPWLGPGMQIQVLGATALIGLFGLAIRPITYAMAMEVGRAGSEGRAVGTLLTINTGVSAIAPVVAGAIGDRFGVGSIYAFLASLMVAAAALCFMLRDTASSAKGAERATA